MKKKLKILKKMNRLQKVFLLYPYSQYQPCQVCAKLSDASICELCSHLLPWLSNYCHFCFKIIHSGQCCGKCQKKKKTYQHASVCFKYASPIAEFVQQLKYSYRLDTAPLLAAFISHKLRLTADQPDAIIPIPLHKKRLRQRGFNQSAEIAKYISKDLSIPILWNNIERIRPTTPQVGLTEKQRRRNLHKAFIITDQNKQLKHYKHILLIDDVITSGSTINSAAASLSKHFKGIISIAAVAKTDF